LFRVFVSSTFADLAAEREALRQDVFPQLRQLCASRGAGFQAVDLRWGVSEEASLDQQAVTICLEEIARSQRRTPRPNFILLLGERYGWRPLPPRIPASELEAIRPHLDPHASGLVEAWYREDRNAVPPEHLLRPREGEAEDEALWSVLEREMREALASAAAAAGLDAVARRRYGASVTEQEAYAGIFEADGAREHVHCFFRTLVGLADGDIPAAFRDMGESRAELLRLKDDLRRFLGEGHVHEYEARWEDGAPSRHHLDQLCADVYLALATVIDAELATAGSRPALERERDEHARFGAERRRHFVGRAEALESVRDYVAGAAPTPLAVVGVSGVGKTALMAQAAADAARAHPEAPTVVRFVGTTARSGVPRALLQDLLAELRRARAASEDTPAAYRDLVEAFREELAQERPTRVLVFIDALDQLGTQGEEVDLAWLPSELPASVRVVVSVAAGPLSALLARRLRAGAVVTIDPLPQTEAGELLRAWLADAGRTLQPHQRDEVLRSFSVLGLPLHLRLAFEEARRWPSFAAQEQTRLADTVPGVIRDLLTRLSRDENHGALLVARSLGLLAASKSGLAEDELLDLLSEDDEVVADFRRRSPRSPELARLPDIVWSRLFSDLEPYLNERSADGRALLAFYHRQLADVIDADFLAGDDRRARHAALAAYFGRQQLTLGGPTEPLANLRKLFELPFQQTHAALWDDLFHTLTNFEFLECKVSGFEAEEHRGPGGQMTRSYPGVFLLQDDFELALRHWPGSDA
jgi:NACHT domain- and WD repeat-containing protein